MNAICNFFKSIFHKLGLGPVSEVSPDQFKPLREPVCSKIEGNAVFGTKDGFLVMIVDHQFGDMPSWAEWDAERKIVSITQTIGDMDEVNADIKPEFIDAMVDHKKILLVSIENDKRIVHFIPFVGRK